MEVELGSFLGGIVGGSICFWIGFAVGRSSGRKEAMVHLEGEAHEVFRRESFKEGPFKKGGIGTPPQGSKPNIHPHGQGG